MSLSCDCGFDDYEWMYTPESDYSTLQTSRRKRCESCNQLINIGSIVLTLNCHRSTRSDIEEDIYGDEVPMANRYLCEECADLYFSLTALDFCITFDGTPLKQQVKEYYENEA